MADEPVSRILRLGSKAPFEQSTYGKQRTYSVSDVNCVSRARITGTRWTHLLCGLSLLAATVFFAGVASAQRIVPIEAPKPKPEAAHIADKKFYFAVSVLAAAKIADATATSRMLSRGCEEGNPFLGQHPSDVRIAGFFAATFAADLGAAYLVKRYGRRHRWARHLWIAIPAYESANHSYLAAKDAGLSCRRASPSPPPPVVLIGPIR